MESDQYQYIRQNVTFIENPADGRHAALVRFGAQGAGVATVRGREMA
jgi:hypothetical protein